MTEQEKQEAINRLNQSIHGAVGYLLILHDIAEKNGSLDNYPVFEDCTMQTILRDYRDLKNIRGW